MGSALGCVVAVCLMAQDGQPRWEAQEIDARAGNVVYAVTVADVDGDGKPDVVAVTEDAVVWYENPSWRKREIIRGQTERDNVCIAAHDIDGDGRVDFALGAGWRPPDTTNASTLQWLGRDAAGEWRVHPIRFGEPSMHRIQWGDVLGTGRKQLVVVPLQGRGTKGPNWGEGNGVKMLALEVPDDPKSAEWRTEVLTDSLHTIHGFHLVDLDGDGRDEVLLAAWEGVYRLGVGGDGERALRKVGDGYQGGSGNKGASEVKLGRRQDGSVVIATIEPWHGDRVVVYERGTDGEGWKRQELAEGVTWGHAVWFADLDLDGDEELVIGQRDPGAGNDGMKGPGVRVYKSGNPPAGGSTAREWRLQVVDDGGMACEDALAADLDGDGRPEIVAGGRATHNVKIYWNRAADVKGP